MLTTRELSTPMGNFARRLRPKLWEISHHAPRSNRRNALHLTLSLRRLNCSSLAQAIQRGSPAKTGSVSPGFWLAFSYLKPGVLLPRLFLRRFLDNSFAVDLIHG